ncbi:uncharacterized protein LOC103313170 isoform X2 [Tribolium castaneum]|uniref:Protein kinase domain-containing protein n=1 Tax=Tribolium castaneum TaxID=7070 RepID=D6WGR7_TRICA|nr:PREDICTED: uncharacterized protein LOC103313170 isoform X2 [Tribolium castaneum]EEZ99620.2 hypothetical protein TcasGA2_TC002138 [Tribolium castaneum]|eukprot:XP_008193946.1 PREDICTED: uncharacterized protein LOC103313170 isoform X2 [Tribolium castaneum]
MEKPWGVLGLFTGLLLCALCNGLPINLENTVADSHTQLLTGLVAVLLTVCSVVFLAGCLCCQRRKGFKEFRDSPVVASAASNLDHGHVNPVANGEFTIFTPLSPPHQNNNVFLANQQIITRTQEDYIFGDVDVSSWFNGTETDFPRIKLKYIKEIGKGWFGRVVEGAAQDIDSEQKWTPVVVRILEATASKRERVVFLHDASIYRCGSHPNILKLIGRCLDTIPLLLLQEYCPQGDLKNYLRQNKPTADKLLSTEYPLVWCCQLSSALKFLHENRLSHPDLAARNCQLTSNLTLKLGDYGLAVLQYPEDYYLGAAGVSVRWCAPESLSYTSTTIEPKTVTLEANIWSFAVTMWEICECGEQPYSSLTDDEVISQVLGSQKVRLSRPRFQMLYNDYIFRLMQLCWTTSESRPAMSQIDLMLGDLLQVYKNTNLTKLEPPISMNDFDKRWESFKPNSIVKTDNQITDNADLDLDDSQIVTSKPLSPSLNNLHGSLDNLLTSNVQMESWLENVATRTGDMSYVRGLSDAIKDLDNAIALENSTSSESSPKIQFRLGPFGDKPQIAESPHESLNDSVQRPSSGSETEEENWKKKIERGAYSEKVRQKSRSVADLMVLTHIDQSESESETPLPSLDYRTNYRNVRYAPKQNLESCGLMFGSEGNLLSVQETFQEELKKLQEERRDSLLFVPENSSQNSDSVSCIAGSSSGFFLQELSEIKPANQVFNVFNVTIDKYSPVRLNLDELINFKEDQFEVPKLADIIKSNSELVDHLKNSDFGSEVMYDSGVEGDKVESTESLRNIIFEPEHITAKPHDGAVYQVQKLVDLIQDNDELMDYIIARYETESVGRMTDSLDSLETPSNELIAKNDCINTTKEFLSREINSHSDIEEPKVAFDLSDSQDEAMPNSLTHSTPFGKKHELTSRDTFSSLNLFQDEKINDSSNLYSLETWDNFLGKALDSQSESQDEMFDSFSSEPQSLLFIANESEQGDKNATFVKEKAVDVDDINVELETDVNGGGWFLHPQSGDVSGEMVVPTNAGGDSYVGFNVDDEIMAAIRTELLNKLPQAQGGSNGVVQDEEEWDSVERNEVFLRYNVYNTPLSPIPEESLLEDNSYTPRQQESDDEDSDWSDQCEREVLPHELESHSAQTLESPVHPERLHRHTPSQDSCCSNDTLFNLEELTCGVNDSERDNNSPTPRISECESQTGEEQQVANNAMIHDINNDSNIGALNDKTTTTEKDSDNSASGCRTSETVKESVEMKQTIEFLAREREHDCSKTSEESNSESTTDHLLPFVTKQVAPLPSPEDNPWKQLPASLLSYDKVMLLPSPEAVEKNNTEENLYVNVPQNNCESSEFENVENLDDYYNEADYVNIVNLENSKNSAEFINNKQINVVIEDASERSSPDYVNNDLIINDDDDNEHDIFGVLTDIRFSGPSDSQMMSTSFSESNDLNDEQDWDSGSDTRSSSSGEFIWKEGEHEESLKALRAAPQDVLEDIHPMEGIQEETSSESSGSDDDGESPEFVPSAWDKYAIPAKSALRSPEKTLEKTDKKKAKGVWFKKQKYHCVYEYPREPESPVLHSFDLWKPQPDYSSFDDWELDGTDPCLPADNQDDCDFTQNYFQAKPNRNLNLYQLSSITDFNSSDPGLDDEFFISSSAKPFDMISGLSSQFFPGNWTDLSKTTENATPDSGVEDITPAGFTEGEFTAQFRTVKPLKQLASEAVKRSKKVEETRNHDMLGGLRHTRNRLKLDLPPSPSAFTSSKMFSIEPVIDPVINREKPTFTTFGKSRFLVQHVDTPPDDEVSKSKNVSFEALPYKPIQKHIIKEDFETSREKGKVESVRGEASLLDSADEDSGIESSTLERKLTNPV